MIIQPAGLVMPAPRKIIHNRHYTPWPDWIVSTGVDETMDFYTRTLAAGRAGGRSKEHEIWRILGRGDLFFLLVFIMNRPDIAEHDWVYDRCREVQREPDGHLDLWFREGYKSTLITQGLTTLNILNDSNVTFGIASHVGPIAKQFLKQIKTEFEDNTRLKDLYPDVLYQRPRRESPKWSEDDGIRVRRTTNPKEETIETFGLVDGQPTSKHYIGLIYDDVVTRESVYTVDQIKKTTDAWELSLNLGARGGFRRTIGTRYHPNDTYQTMMDRRMPVRRWACTIEGVYPGTPHIHTPEALQEKYEDMGRYTFSAQMLQDPKADRARQFDKAWRTYHSIRKTFDHLNRYILVDPSSGKKRPEGKKNNDYSSFQVIGLGPDKHMYVLFLMRDRLKLNERWETLKWLHETYDPKGVGYEEYGMQADIEYFEEHMRSENYRFAITPLGGNIPKRDRIENLMPEYEHGRLILPENCIHTTRDGRTEDFVQTFIRDEYDPYPLVKHDDMLDCQARIKDPALGAVFPRPIRVESSLDRRLRDAARRTGTSWQAH